MPRKFLGSLFSGIPPIEADPQYLASRETQRVVPGLLWLAGIVVTSTVYFLIYFTPVHLHDISHFATAGVSLVRDHKDLAYPYQGPTYESFQAHTAILDARINYPSKLYSALFGLICAATGRMRLEYTQGLSLAAFLLANVLLYLIGRRFFSGLRLASLLVCTAFFPVMRFALNPGIDLFGYLGLLFLLWLSIAFRINPILFGVYAGILAHFRAQMVSIPLVFPILLTAFSTRSFFRQTAIPVLVGFCIGYGALAAAFILWLHSNHAANPVGFYTTYWANSMLGPSDRMRIVKKLVDAVVSIFDSSQLSFLAPTAIACLFCRHCPPARRLAVGALVYIAVPIALYSVDRYFQPRARYYMFAVPLIVLAAFLALQSISWRKIRFICDCAFPLLAAASVFTWQKAYGFPVQNLRSASVISRACYLDFAGADDALAASFAPDDIVIVNHALPTGLSHLHNVLYIPSPEHFRAGDNTKIEGLVFVYSNNSPNEFFSPKDWFIDGVMPSTLRDQHGLVFRRVFFETSKLLGPDGSVQSEAYFEIYKQNSRSK